ncbi:hypothetical protein BU15DRAFT_77532 [Melanogaster broomeanus]|nr:hypothetical protein BU15DRAFT_77532 [Melanogaster broomeanus]
MSQSQFPRKRKLMDKSISNDLFQLPEFARSQNLLEIERKLDWTVMRKTGGVGHVSTNPNRMFKHEYEPPHVANYTVSDQAWQGGEADGEVDVVSELRNWTGHTKMLFESGRASVGGTKPAVARQSDTSQFLTFIKRMIVDLDRDPTLYGLDGLDRKQAASEAYYHALSKKKESPASGEAKELMSLNALGIVMATHGEEFGGTSLVKLGRAQCKIATLQEAYALTFQDTFITSCEKLGQDIKDYEYQRKKLDSRRLSYDAATSKLEKIKSRKKEKEKETTTLSLTKETSEDVHTRMQAIQENEIVQLCELTTFLDSQVNFARQYFETLQDVKVNWKLGQFENMKTNSRARTPPRADQFHTIRS